MATSRPLKAKIPGSSPGGAAKLCSCSPTGRGCRLKNGMLWVQFPPRVPKLAPVAQLEEVADLKSVCCGFDSHQEYQRDVIQWREAMLWEHGVAGSSPAIPICRCRGTWHKCWNQSPDFAGSNLVETTKISGCSAVGSAGISGTPGRRFNPCHSDFALVAQRKRRFA